LIEVVCFSKAVESVCVELVAATHSSKAVEIGAVDVHLLVLVLCHFGNHFRLEEAIVV